MHIRQIQILICKARKYEVGALVGSKHQFKSMIYPKLVYISHKQLVLLFIQFKTEIPGFVEKLVECVQNVIG